MTTFTINTDEIIASNPSAAVRMAGFLYSDIERDTIGAIYFDAVAKLGALIEHDAVGADAEANKLIIGECVAVLLCIIAKLTIDNPTFMPPVKWQDRGPDTEMKELPFIRIRLAENAGRIAKNARAVIMADTLPVKRAGTMALGNYCRGTIHTGDGLDLYAYAAVCRLSLRECFEAFAATRKSKLTRNAKRFGAQVG